MKNKKVVLFTLVLLVVAFIGVLFLYQNSVDNKNQELMANKNGAPFQRAHSPSFGENKNKVVIVEFLDPQCGSCSAFHPIIKEIFNDYKMETKLVLRYLDNHNNSKFAIRLLEAARLQNKYNETLEIMFKYQQRWGNTNNPKPKLLWDFLPEAGLDMAKLKKDFENNDIDEMLNLDRKDATTLGVRGTPTFYVNGKVLRVLSHKGLLDLVESEIYK